MGWVIYEMDFPEGSNVRAPGGFCFPCEPFFSALLELFLPCKNQLNLQNLKEEPIVATQKSISGELKK
jgi:hypothetical protein